MCPVRLSNSQDVSLIQRVLIPSGLTQIFCSGPGERGGARRRGQHEWG